MLIQTRRKILFITIKRPLEYNNNNLNVNLHKQCLHKKYSKILINFNFEKSAFFKKCVFKIQDYILYDGCVYKLSIK